MLLEKGSYEDESKMNVCILKSLRSEGTDVNQKSAIFVTIGIF